MGCCPWSDLEFATAIDAFWRGEINYVFWRRAPWRDLPWQFFAAFIFRSDYVSLFSQSRCLPGRSCGLCCLTSDCASFVDATEALARPSYEVHPAYHCRLRAFSQQSMASRPS